MVHGVERQQMRRLVSAARVARLATVDAGGAPHLVPFCFAVLDDVVYSAVDHKPKRSQALRRLANIAANAHACVLVDHYSDDWFDLWWVRLDGRGRVVTDPEEAARAVRALVAKYPQYAERPPTGPVLAVEVTRWTGWSAA
jgi:PPOX class probable F420-dependent enzyme